MRTGPEVVREKRVANLFDGTEGMVDIAEILRQMEANVPNPSSTSRRLWTLRRAPCLASHNRSRDTMLEKAVAMLAANGHMPGWFNQCPTAAGIGGSSRTRRTNVDLRRRSAVRAGPAPAADTAQWPTLMAKRRTTGRTTGRSS